MYTHKCINIRRIPMYQTLPSPGFSTDVIPLRVLDFPLIILSSGLHLPEEYLFIRTCKMTDATKPAPMNDIPSEIGEELRDMSRHGDLSGVKALISGKKPAVTVEMMGSKDGQSGNTALHFCCANGHSDIAEFLIAQGNPCNISNNSGSTPLHYAALMGQLTVVKSLIKSGKCDLIHRNNFGNTPLDEALQCNHRDVADELMKAVEELSAKSEANGKDGGDGDDGGDVLAELEKDGKEGASNKK